MEGTLRYVIHIITLSCLLVLFISFMNLVVKEKAFSGIETKKINLS